MFLLFVVGFCSFYCFTYNFFDLLKKLICLFITITCVQAANEDILGAEAATRQENEAILQAADESNSAFAAREEIAGQDQAGAYDYLYG